MMAPFRLGMALLATSVFALPVSAAPQTSLSQVRAPASERALTLAGILNSDANIVGDNQDDEKALALVPELFGSKEDLVKLEAEYPGISTEMARAALPAINRHMRARLPELWQRQAALYDSSLTAEELDHLIAFYSSSTGRKMVAAMFRHIKPTAMMADAKSSDGMAVSPEAVLKDIKRTLPNIVSEMDETDKAHLMATFSRPGLAPKMQALAPKTQAITLEWMNESAPGEDEELEKIMTLVIERRQKGDVK